MAHETGGELLEIEATYGGAGPHTMTADEPARIRWKVSPALRTAEFFERLMNVPHSPPMGGSAGRSSRFASAG